MGIAATIGQACAAAHIGYDVRTHAPSLFSQQTAQAAHVPGDKLAKAILFEDQAGAVMAVVPATHRLEIDTVNDLLGRNLKLMEEERLAEMFADCELGAVPPIGPAYNLQTVMDDCLAGLDEVWFEGGDHENIVHMAGPDFMRLMRDAKLGRISHHC